MKIKTKLSCVRYPGGKSNALKTLDPFFPKRFSTYKEPFFGGGSVGLYLMQTHKNADFHINDLFYPVFCFWKMLKERPDDMVKVIFEMKRAYSVDNGVTVKGIPSKSALSGKELHRKCREHIETVIEQKDEFQTACLWYILNKTSFSGMAMIGSYAALAWDQNFTDNCITNLPKTSELMNSVKSCQITNKDYSTMLGNEGTDTFIFLDPPYDIKDNLYGNEGDMHKGFNHKLFCDKAKLCNHNWMITYNANPFLIKQFKGYNCKEWDLQYTMKAAKRTVVGELVSSGNVAPIQLSKDAKSEKTGKKGKELLVWNYNL